MVAEIFTEAGDIFLREEERTPECGTDFCDRCGDCLHCYGGDPCVHDARGEHRWIIYGGARRPVPGDRGRVGAGGEGVPWHVQAGMRDDHLYILDGHTPVPVNDVQTWGRWFETADRRVALDVLGDVEVSTVFMGMNLTLGAEPPLLFETMAFRGRHEIRCDRYATWDEAEAGHTAMLALVAEEEAAR
jgi:hypothetical protein